MEYDRARGCRVRSGDAAVHITRRDVDVVTWIAEQYAVSIDTLGVLLGGRARSTAQRWLNRMRAVRWVQTAMMIGKTWIWVSTLGLHACDLSNWRSRQPAVTQLEHLDAIACVRLWYRRQMPDAHWMSERRIASNNTDGGVVPDGVLLTVQREPIAIQVERTMRDPQYYQRVLERLDARFPHIVYVHAVQIGHLLQRAMHGHPKVQFVELEPILIAMRPRWRQRQTAIPTLHDDSADPPVGIPPAPACAEHTLPWSAQPVWQAWSASLAEHEPFRH